MSQQSGPITIGPLPWRNTIARILSIRQRPPLLPSTMIWISPSRPWTTWTNRRLPSYRRCWDNPFRRPLPWSCSSRRKSAAAGRPSLIRTITSYTYRYHRPCRTKPQSTPSFRCWSLLKKSWSVMPSCCASAKIGSTARTWCERSRSSVFSHSVQSRLWFRHTSRNSREMSISSWSTTLRSKMHQEPNHQAKQDQMLRWDPYHDPQISTSVDGSKRRRAMSVGTIVLKLNSCH